MRISLSFFSARVRVIGSLLSRRCGYQLKEREREKKKEKNMCLRKWIEKKENVFLPSQYW